MAFQNITLRIEKDLLENTKMLAAARNVSISELFESMLRKILAEDATFRMRRNRFRKRLKKGFDLGSHGKAPRTRTELHER